MDVIGVFEVLTPEKSFPVSQVNHSAAYCWPHELHPSITNVKCESE